MLTIAKMLLTSSQEKNCAHTGRPLHGKLESWERGTTVLCNNPPDTDVQLQRVIA